MRDELRKVKLCQIKIEGSIYNPPKKKHILQAVSKALTFHFHSWQDMNELDSIFREEIGGHQGLYELWFSDNPSMIYEWICNIGKIEGHVASTVDGAIAALTLRKSEYPNNCYHFYVVIESPHNSREFISIEMLINPPNINEYVPFVPADPSAILSFYRNFSEQELITIFSWENYRGHWVCRPP